MNSKIIGFLTSILILTGCQGPDSVESTIVSGNSDAARADLIESDLGFAQMAGRDGIVSAYEVYLADSAVQLPDGGYPIVGKALIMENVQAAVADVDFKLTWKPEDARVSRSGDLGYTWGSYFLESEDETGQIFTSDGKYANVWQKNADDKWRVVLDISNQNESLFEDVLDFLPDSD